MSKSGFVCKGLSLIPQSFPSKVSSEVLERFLVDIEAEYVRSAPYHNADHGACVMVSSNEIFLSSKWDFSIDKRFAHLALLVAGICHDVGHPGQQKPRDVQSVEQIHVDITQKVLMRHDFLVNMSQRDKRLFKSILSELILHTNMSLHGKLLNDSKSLWNKRAPKELDTTSKDVLVLTLMLKAADIWHSTFEWESHRAWADRFVLETTGTTEVNAEDIENQVWFMKAIAIPLVHTVGRLAKVSPALDKCYSNLDKWCNVVC